MNIPRFAFGVGLSILIWPAALPGAVENQVIELWPEGIPGFRSKIEPERVEEPGHLITHVNRPTLTVCPPTGPNSHTAVVDCPGGGYETLAFDNNAVIPTRWLNRLGITVFQLKYRLSDYGHPAPLQDVLRAMRIVRSRAAEFGIRPDHIGAIGFSAGGHLAACAATLYDAPEGRTGTPLDAVSARPDFVILIYPVIMMTAPEAEPGSRKALLGTNPSEELSRRLSPELQVTKRTSPSFIVQTEEDHTVPAENSIRFYQALWRAGVPVEMHLYEKGPHGFGLGLQPGLGPTSGWPKRCEEWMRFHGWLPPPP